VELRCELALHLEEVGTIVTTAPEADLRTRATGVTRAGWTWLCDNPLAWSGALLAVALAVFVVFEASVIPGMGFWVDELFSFWAGDARIPFAEAFSTRILPDSNAPIYFSLIYLVQGAGLEGRAAFLVLNFIVMGSLLALLIERGWRMGMLATALSAVAVLLVSGPLLTYAPEGRVYGMAMVLCAVIAFCCGGVVAGFKVGRGELILAAVLAVLGAWMHVFAAVFAGSLAAALVMVGWLLLRRSDVVALGFVMGSATILACILWLTFAFPLFTGSTSWMTFTPKDVFDAVWTFKEHVAGPLAGALACIAFVGLSLLFKHSRAMALVLCITGALFFAIPVAISFKMPMFVGRYLLIAGPGLLVLLLFVLRAHLVERSASPSWRNRLAALGALFFVFPITQGMPAAAYSITNRHDWRGSEIVVPAIDQCSAGEIRTLFAYPRVYGFEYYLDGRLTPVIAGAAPVRDLSTIDCPVYGWAEEYKDVELGGDWYKTADIPKVLSLFRLTNTNNLPLEIIRHEGGLVLARAGAASR
jgi:hypothetical protein